MSNIAQKFILWRVSLIKKMQTEKKMFDCGITIAIFSRFDWLIIWNTNEFIVSEFFPHNYTQRREGNVTG